MKSGFEFKEIAQNTNSTNNEKREKVALSILKDIRTKVEDIGDPPYISNQNQLNNTKQLSLNLLFCSACLLPVQNGDFAYCLNCCNAICHISCLAQIAEYDKSTMEHQCPNCCQNFSPELIHRFKSMQQLIDSVHDQK